jgi:hypothetical protein
MNSYDMLINKAITHVSRLITDLQTVTRARKFTPVSTLT